MNNSNFLVEHTSRYFLTHVIKASITNHESHEHHVPPNMTDRGGHNTAFMLFLPNMHYLNLIMMKHQTNES